MYEYSEVLHLWHLASSCEDLHDLEVGYVGFISNACAGAYNPAIGLQGYVTDILSLQHYS